MKTFLVLTAVAATFVAGGCCCSSHRHEGREVEARRFGRMTWTYVEPSSTVRPRLKLSQSEISAALEESKRFDARHEAEARSRLAEVSLEDVAGVASAVSLCYDLGARGVASSLEGQGVFSWEKARGRVADIECHFSWRRPSRLELCHEPPLRPCGVAVLDVRRREGVTGAIAVTFPPGTYAFAEMDDPDGWTTPEQEKRYGKWPRVQNLALMKAPVLLLPAGTDEASVEVPIACASFRSHAPSDGVALSLGRFREGSTIDRLMLALCARGAEATASEAQLAVWVARNDISFSELVRAGRLVTFEGCCPVGSNDAHGAARVLLRASVDPRDTRFFSQDDKETGKCVPAHEALEQAPAPAPSPSPPAERPAPGAASS